MDAAEPSPRWEHFPHDADMGIRGIGHSKAEAFEQAALALTAVTLDPDQDPSTSGRGHFPVKPRMMSCYSWDWLNALVCRNGYAEDGV